MMIFCAWVKGIKCRRKVILISFFVERHFLLKGRLAKSQGSDVNAQSSEPHVRLQGHNVSCVAISAKRVGL